MSVRNSLEHTRHWRQYLLQDSLHPELPAALPDFLKQTGRAFLATVPEHVDDAQHAELNHWYWSAEGQATLAAFANRLWVDMASVSEHAMPAHDARHAMFKVPAMALEYIAAENVSGWERVGVLGGLLHDYGRWAEERVFGEPCDSMIHARLSYLLGQELLEGFAMPALMRKHILLAAIRHTSGAEPRDPMPLKLTVSADRDQLYGAEVVLRLSHHMVNPAGDMSSFYGERPGLSVLKKLEHCLFNRLPGPLFTRQAHCDTLWWSLANFILMSEDADASRERFIRRTTGAPGLAPLPHTFVWESAWAQADALRCAAPAPDAAEALLQLLSAPNVAPGRRYLEDACRKVAGLGTLKAERLAAALGYIHRERITEDARQVAALKDLAKAYTDDALVGSMTALLLKHWDDSAS